MTRDEAIELAHEKWVTPNTKSSECIVDILVTLGILKLDEPKSSVDESARSERTKDYPKRMFWCGEPIDEMPRERLLEIITRLSQDLESTRMTSIRNMEVFSNLAKARARS